jgi:hypothetical protein
MMMMMMMMISEDLYGYSDCKLEATMQDNTHVTVLLRNALDVRKRDHA